MASLDTFAQIEHGAHLTRAGSAGIRGQAHKVHIAIYTDVFHQVRVKQNAAAQNTHKQRLFAAVIRRNLAAQFGHSFR